MNRPTNRSTMFLPFTLLIVALSAATAHAQDSHLARVRDILSTTPLIDGHNDLAWTIREYEPAPHDVRAYDLRQRTTGHTDIERLREGMVGAQFWSVYIPCEAVEQGAARVQLEQIDIARQFIARYPDVFELARTASDIERIYGSGRIASLLGMEGGHAIENSLGALRAYYDLGVRYMTLTHNCTNDWADAASDEPQHGGLTPFGEEIVREMNRLGMLVDLSHVSPATMQDALDVTEAPVIFSHSGARAVTDHVRNVPDDVLERLPDNGGIVMVPFVASFVSEEVRTYEGPEADAPRATIADVVAHIEHIVEVAGIDHVGLGSDFDGTSQLPIGLEDVSKFPALLAELSRRGWSDEELRKFAGENLLRVMREAEAASRRLRRQRAPSTTTIAGLEQEVSPEP